MLTHELHWERLLNRLVQRYHENRKLNVEAMPMVVECGLGGNFGIHIRDVSGYNAVKPDKYRWFSAGESQEYKYEHQQILTPFKERTLKLENDLLITAKP